MSWETGGKEDAQNVPSLTHLCAMCHAKILPPHHTKAAHAAAVVEDEMDC